MELFTPEQMHRLLTNGHPANRDKDHVPVVKLFLPGTGFTWLLSELDPFDPDWAYGLCDMGMDSPELGQVSIYVLKCLVAPHGYNIEPDLTFEGRHPMSVYVHAAKINRGITTFENDLTSAANDLKPRFPRLCLN